MGKTKRTLSWFAKTVWDGVLGYLGFYLGIYVGLPLLAFINGLLPQWAWNGMFFSVVMSAVYDFWVLLMEEEPIPAYSLNEFLMVPAGPPMTSLGAKVRRTRPRTRAMFLGGPIPSAHRCVRFGRTRLR
jgi:hypothetical protein